MSKRTMLLPIDPVNAQHAPLLSPTIGVVRYQIVGRVRERISI